MALAKYLLVLHVYASMRYRIIVAITIHQSTLGTFRIVQLTRKIPIDSIRGSVLDATDCSSFSLRKLASAPASAINRIADKMVALMWTIPNCSILGPTLADNVLDDPPSQKIRPVSLSISADSPMTEASIPDMVFCCIRFASEDDETDDAIARSMHVRDIRRAQ